ncbi:MAG: hypothetical protein QOF30_3025 [Acidimicrobiaceae bacterium]|jgi:hypothetical protein|nr:hypothetical protein [Acidimicrobiaceae bacterium]
MMRGRQVSLGAVVWIVIGFVVAATHHFLETLNSASTIGSAVLAVIAWPLVLLHIHIAI